jgi:hypothetical protein
MRVSMENGEQTDNAHGENGGHIDAQRNQDAEHDHRKADPVLDERKRDTGKTEDTAENHHADESRRHEPQGPSAEVGRKHADGNHRHHVIQATDRMHESMQEAPLIMEPDMGKGRRYQHSGKNGR